MNEIEIHILPWKDVKTQYQIEKTDVYTQYGTIYLCI